MQGDGSIESEGRGKWRVYLSLGCDPLTGKYKKVSRRVTGTKADAKKVLSELRRQKEGGIRLDKANTTMHELCELWLSAKRASGSCDSRQVNAYAAYLRYVCAHIGNVSVCDVDARIVETVYGRIKSERGLSNTTMRGIHTCLKSVFEKAIDYDLIVRNPCRRISMPKPEPVERRSLSRGEVAALRSALEQEYALLSEQMQQVQERQTERGNYAVQKVDNLFNLSCVAAVRIILATGLRRGEAFALTWGDVDPEAQTLKVRHSLTKTGDIKQPKSKAGIRNLAFDPATAEFLRGWKSAQAEYLRRLGVIQGANTPVSCSNAGGFVTIDNVSRFWNRFREKYGFAGLKLHELRHTQATQLLANGADLKMVQTRLGHSSASLTLGTYAHAIPENDGKAAQIMGDLMGGSEHKSA